MAAERLLQRLPQFAQLVLVWPECQQHIDPYDVEPYVTQAVELPPPPYLAGTDARCPSADIIDSTDDVQ